VSTRITTSEIDPASVERFRAEVDDAVGRAADAGGQVVLDFTDVEFIDSTGLTVLLDAHRTLGAQDRTLTVANLQGHIRRVFEVTGLTIFLDD
jgi:anti-anti-sigma factor